MDHTKSSQLPYTVHFMKGHLKKLFWYVTKIVTVFHIFYKKVLVNCPICNIFVSIFDCKLGSSVKWKLDVPEISWNTDIQLQYYMCIWYNNIIAYTMCSLVCPFYLYGLIVTTGIKQRMKKHETK